MLNLMYYILDFMRSKMSDDALFFAASDADTDGEEGKYFVYGYEEVLEALERAGFGEAETKEICETLSITPRGNFEGKNIVRFRSDERPAWWPKVRHVLKTLRARRTYPFVDKKIITSWNAMMAKALFMAADIDERYLKEALRTMEALLTLVRREKSLFHSCLAGKEPTVEGFLEDYAYLCDALLAAYETTLEETWLLKAQELANEAIEKFHDRGRWYFSRGEFTTEADIADTSYPASGAVMTGALLTLGTLLEEPAYLDIAFKSLEINSYKIMRTPLYHPAFTEAALRWLHEDVVVKSLPNRLAQAKETMARATYPWILPKSAVEPDFLVCNRHSCFADARTLEVLEKALMKL